MKNNISQESKNEQIDKLSRLAKTIYYIIIIVITSVFGGILYSRLHWDWVVWYSIVLILLHIEWLIINLRTKFIIDKYFTPFYYAFIGTYLFPFILILWQNKVYSILLLYILLPMIIMYLFFATKYMVHSVLFVLLYLLMVIFISSKVQVGQVIGNEDFVAQLNIAFIIMAIGLVLLFFYFYYQILKCNTVISVKEEPKTPTKENKNLEELYNNVIAYFEKKQPYRQPNYRLAMLAAELNSNTTYLSNAITMYFGGTFEGLLNKYRLQYAKKMLDDGLAQKFTMEYIYTTSGYANKSTFYKNFHKTYKMTPSEYQEMKNENV